MTDITHIPFPGNRENLRKLIEGAKAYATKYPEQFDMGSFNSSGIVDPVEAVKTIHTCGTTACFLGLGPTIEGLEAFTTDGHWGEYGKRVFGIEAITLGDAGLAWDWLFAGDWGAEDLVDEGFGSIWHAIARAEYALELGVPSNAVHQASGTDDLTYLAYVREPA